MCFKNYVVILLCWQVKKGYSGLSVVHNIMFYLYKI